MTNLEDFCIEIANELGISLETEDKSPKEFLMFAESDNIRLSYQKYAIGENPSMDSLEKGPYGEIFAVKNNEDAEVRIARTVREGHSGKFTLSLGLPSLSYKNYLARLDKTKPLSKIFIDKFSKRESEEASENSTFIEYTKITDLKPVKDLIYAVFLIKMSYESVAEEVNNLIHMPHYNSGNEMICALEDFYKTIGDKQGKEHFSKYVHERLSKETNPNIKEILEEVCKECNL